MKKTIIFSLLLSMTLLSGCGGSSSTSNKSSSEDKTYKANYELKGTTKVDIKDLKTSKTSTIKNTITVSEEPKNNLGYISIKGAKNEETLYLEKDHFLLKNGNKYSDISKELKDSNLQHLFSLGKDFCYFNPYVDVDTLSYLTETSSEKTSKDIDGTKVDVTMKTYEGGTKLEELLKKEVEDIFQRQTENDTVKALKDLEKQKKTSDKAKSDKIAEIEKTHSKSSKELLSNVKMSDVKAIVYIDKEKNIRSSNITGKVNLNDSLEMTFDFDFDVVNIGDSVKVPLVEDSAIEPFQGDLLNKLSSLFEQYN